MGFDLINKDMGRKKKTNRLAKLKQSKLDVRREQWLSHVRNKGCMVDSNETGGSPPPSMQMTVEGYNKSSNSSALRSRGVHIEGSIILDREFESLASSPDGTNMGQSNQIKHLPLSSCSSATSMCCSASVSETEEEDDCLDDWEAIADALTAEEKQHNPNLETSIGLKPNIQLADSELCKKNLEIGILQTESKRNVCSAHENHRVWRPDDVFRPRSLPNAMNRLSVNVAQTWPNVISQPSSCPICCEDLDITDSSFLPCPCGFHLCLFCHKRILEADERCPGCRKQYDSIKGNERLHGGHASFQMQQSVGMSTMS